MSLCIVCNENKGEYKCKVCKSLYCSSNCYKIHKQQCKIEDQGNIKQNDEKENKEISPFEVFRSNKDIVNSLSDKRLQEIIKRIDSAEDREGELIKEMERNLYFKEFALKVLKQCPKEILP